MNQKEKLVWEHLLDADLNKRYFELMTRRYHFQDKFAKIAIAFTASGTVGSWWIWEQYVFDHLWQVLSGITAVISILLSVFDPSKNVEISARLKGEYSNLLREYEILWAHTSKLNLDKVEENLRELWKIETELSKLDGQLPTNKKKWIIKIQNEITIARGLNHE